MLNVPCCIDVKFQRTLSSKMESTRVNLVIDTFSPRYRWRSPCPGEWHPFAPSPWLIGSGFGGDKLEDENQQKVKVPRLIDFSLLICITGQNIEGVDQFVYFGRAVSTVSDIKVIKATTSWGCTAPVLSPGCCTGAAHGKWPSILLTSFKLSLTLASTVASRYSGPKK